MVGCNDVAAVSTAPCWHVVSVKFIPSFRREVYPYLHNLHKHRTRLSQSISLRKSPSPTDLPIFLSASQVLFQRLPSPSSTPNNLNIPSLLNIIAACTAFGCPASRSAPPLHQNLHNLIIALEHRPSDRTLTPIIQHIDVHSLVNQHLDSGGVTVVCGEHDQGVAFVVGEI